MIEAEIALAHMSEICNDLADLETENMTGLTMGMFYLMGLASLHITRMAI